MKKDKTGISYEALIEASVRHLGYKKDTQSGKNYIRPSIKEKFVIEGTYIQPDLVLRDNEKIIAILYITHWTRRRNSSLKFWRTWEESAQQKIVLENELLTINCIFECLPTEMEPRVCRIANDLPDDQDQNDKLPVKLHGWDAGIGWAMIEAFDVSLVYPLNYIPSMIESRNDLSKHDSKTDLLLNQALLFSAKEYLYEQWNILRDIRNRRGMDSSESHTETKSRFRIGLLHIYLLHRLIQACLAPKKISVESLLSVFLAKTGGADLDSVANSDVFLDVSTEKIKETFVVLSGVYVRKGKNPEKLCETQVVKTIRRPSGELKLKFNQDLQICLKDLTEHLCDQSFLQSVEDSFREFDNSFQIEEALEDLSNIDLVRQKENFVRANFSESLKNCQEVYSLLEKHGMKLSEERLEISRHEQNWILEMLVYLCGLEVEDIYSKFIDIFEDMGTR